EPSGPQFKAPHMGWNTLDGRLPGAMFEGLPAGSHMYFTHSFAIFPGDEADVAAYTDHGGRFAAAVLRGHVAGVQFHPEKSQAGGGVRTLGDIETWIEAGVSRVILGTAAVRDPEMVKDAARRWPEQIAVSVDVRKGQVAVQGWLEDSGLGALEVARRFEDAGV